MNVSPISSAVGARIERATIIETGIESTQSHEFSVGIFIFLIMSIGVFAVVVVKFMRSGGAGSLKLGEKIMFGWIFFGIVVAIIMGATQLFFGQLF